MPNGVSIGQRGWSGQIPSLPLSFWLLHHMHGSHGCVDQFWRSICHMTSFHARLRPLWAMLIHTPFRKSTPQKLQIGDVNRHFQTKHAKYSDFHIIETTGWIPTKFCTPVKNTNILCGHVGGPQTQQTNPKVVCRSLCLINGVNGPVLLQFVACFIAFCFYARCCW